MTKNLQIIAVHGTFSGKENVKETSNDFYDERSNFAKNLKEAYRNYENIDWVSFYWSGKNSQKARSEAAKRLSKEIKQKISQYEKTVILAHSHGGNVSLTAMDLLSESGVEEIDRIKLFSFGTPYVQFKHRNILGRIFQGLIFVTILPLTLAFLSRFIKVLIDFGFGWEVSNLEIIQWGSVFIVPIFLIFAAFDFFYVPLKKLQFRRLRKLNSFLVVFCHEEDEAVSLLQSNTALNLSMPIFPLLCNLLVFPSTLLIFFIFLFQSSLGIVSSDLDAFDSWYFIALWSFGVSFVFWKLMAFLSVLINFGFNKFFDRIKSQLFSSFLWKVARGSDDDRDFLLGKTPDIPENCYMVVEPKGGEKSNQYYNSVGMIAEQSLSGNKSELLSELMRCKGDLFLLVGEKPDLAKSLIHCCYFLPEETAILVSNLTNVRE